MNYITKSLNEKDVLTTEELIKILKQYPSDAKIFISNLCMGWIDDESVEYNENENVVEFVKVVKH